MTKTAFIGDIHGYAPALELALKWCRMKSVDGVLAAGDCRMGAVAQVAAATGEGVMASYAVRRFLSN